MLKYFNVSEFDQKDGKLPGSGANMVCEYLRKLDELRELCGFPLVVNSGYRSPEYNNRVSGSGLTGPHTTGKAADFAIDTSQKRYIILKHAFDLGFTGIGVGKSFVHLDTLDDSDEFTMRPNVWTY